MARQDMTLEACTDGLAPRFTSLYPLGDRPYLSGGASALEWVTNGDLSDGDYLEVRTNIDGLFGATDPTFQSFSIVGDETLENGVANNWLSAYSNNQYLKGRVTSNASLSTDANSAYDGILNAVKTDITRHANIPSAILFNSFSGQTTTGTETGVCVWPKAYIGAANNRVLPAGDLFCATWMYYDFDDGAEMIAIKYDNVVGTFNTGSNTVPTISAGVMSGGVVNIGEPCTIVNPVGKTATGYVNVVDAANKIVYFYQNENPAEWTKAEYYGSVITGSNSGAVCTFENVTSWLAGTTYANGVKVFDPSFGKCYVSQQNGNTGHDPVGDGGTWWVIDAEYLFDEGSSKSGRFMQNEIVNGVNTSTLIIGVEGSISAKVFHDGTSEDGKGFNSKPAPHTWHRRTVWVDYRPDGDGKIWFKQLIDGVYDEVGLNHWSARRDIRPILSNWGIEANTDNGHTAICSELKTYTDIMYALVSDSATYAGIDLSTAEPLSRVGQRTSTKAGFRVSKGVYSSLSGKYLYVMSDPNTPINSSGLLLTGA